jgi:hypothetical protein
MRFPKGDIHKGCVSEGCSVDKCHAYISPPRIPLIKFIFVSREISLYVISVIVNSVSFKKICF